jgi:hypothetical protein
LPLCHSLAVTSFYTRVTTLARRGPVRLAATLAGVATLVAFAPRAPAKEHTAACPELPSILGRIRAGVQCASGQRLRGSSLGAYQVLQLTAASIARDSAGRHCGALGQTVNAALARSARARTALDASIELDQGLDDTLSLASDGQPQRNAAPPKLLPVAEATLYAEGCPDLFALALRLDGPRGTVAARVGAVLSDLRAHPRCALVRHVLEAATPDRLAHAVDSVRLDEPEETDASPDLMTRCPELPLVVDKLALAIAVGAPQFNAGDAAGCRHTYEGTAAAVATQLVPEGRCPAVRTLLAAGLARAKAADDDRDAAWDLRHAFDAILSEQPGPGTAP